MRPKPLTKRIRFKHCPVCGFRLNKESHAPREYIWYFEIGMNHPLWGHKQCLEMVKKPLDFKEVGYAI